MNKTNSLHPTEKEKDKVFHQASEKVLRDHNKKMKKERAKFKGYILDNFIVSSEYVQKVWKEYTKRIKALFKKSKKGAKK